MNQHNASSAHERIGKAIRARRRAFGLSLGELAAKLGVANSTMSKLEHGNIPITFERLEAISKVLRVDMVALLADERGPIRNSDEAKPSREDFGTRRSVTRAEAAIPVDASLYTLFFHATDLLEKRCQPAKAEVHLTDIADYGPLTRHSGEEFNYVLSGEVEFHTDVYAPVRLRTGDSIYFDAEMGHAHIKLGVEPCFVLAIFVSRASEAVRGNMGPVLEIARAHEGVRRVEPARSPPKRAPGSQPKARTARKNP